MEGMPPGTLGFRASGTIGRADYAEVVLPAVHEALEQHGRLRSLHQLGPDLEEFDLRALWAEVRDVNTLGMEHLGRLERTALATDEEAIRGSVARFAWMLPGEFRMFAVAEIGDAKAWLGDGR